MDLDKKLREIDLSKTEEYRNFKPKSTSELSALNSNELISYKEEILCLYSFLKKNYKIVIPSFLTSEYCKTK